MPNYCNNTLLCYGTEENINKFLTAICTSEHSETTDPYDYSILHKLVPTPQDLVDTVAGWSADPVTQAEYQRKFDENLAKYGHKDWYDWNLDNWGTKWADGETHIAMRNDGFCGLRFETPWCAPEAGIDKVSKLFPEIEFVLTYMEQGVGFVGATAYKNGTVASSYSESITMPNYDDENYDDLLDNIDEVYFETMEQCEAQVMLEAGFKHG